MFRQLKTTVQFILIAGLGLALAACQSVPAKGGFSKEQIAVLQHEGFLPVDDDWHLTLPSRLLFGSDKRELEPEKLEEIAQLARSLVAVDIRSAVIEGHTDSTASDEYNFELSQARAQNVAAPMTANGMHFTPEQVIGRGETFPSPSNDTPEGRQDNRRVVIIVSPN